MKLKIGLQLYSVRNSMQKDYIRTMREVAEAGYKYLELANLNAAADFGCGFNVPAKELKKIAQDTGCEIFSAHIYPFTDGNVDRILDYHAELGTKFLMSKPLSETRSVVDRDCEMYDRIGEKCRKYGIVHSLHTGLAPLLDDGSPMLDVIFGNTQPENLAFEVDTYWMLRSGFKPEDIIKKYADRVIAVHQKDLPKSFSKTLDLCGLLGKGKNLNNDNYTDYVGVDDFCEIGTGQMDIQSIIDTALEYTKAEYIVLEQDFTRYSEKESIELSFEGFKKYHGVQLS